MTKVTEIQLTPIKPHNGLVAFASFVLDDKWYAGNVAVYTRPSGGYRLVYPTKKLGDSNMEIFHPISREAGGKVEQEVIQKLEELWTTGNNRSEKTTTAGASG